MILGNIYFYTALLVAAIFCSAVGTSAQNKKGYDENFCSDNWSGDGKISFTDRRELNLPFRNTLEVDGDRNGGISIRGENRNDISIRACVTAWDKSESAAQNAAKRINISTNSVIKAENGGDNWSVSYQIVVPQNINLKLTANNGGISINSVEGTIEFFTKNGGVHLQDLAGNVSGRTQNGGVSIKLSGNTWTGNGLDVETKNGGVNLSMSQNYAANIETGTTNGGFKSEFSELQPENKKSWGKRQISTNLNGGGAPIRVVTTNGGIRIDSF